MAEKEHVVQKDGNVNTENVDEALDKIDPERMDHILSNFNEFKTYLHKRLDVAKKIGLNEEQLASTAEKVADYLADKVEPKNREEKLIQELWKVGNEEERHKLAHMLVKLVDQP
ncbi:DUF3243 domain-containing protein [Bacillus sp. CECT 9360]|uniref:DUF3243 domain-containing protein n=1 Tax=Bacillus sp. CECT 9360 TaxID=2845821 RepID=UPI001E34448E|nr:DUF3243 domain-containing protein [Bacillus sp. CECT 9360]CAH0344309.1 hypothetical protein BCI9360_00557 [Bacillus sp. CECT 9360]